MTGAFAHVRRRVDEREPKRAEASRRLTAVGGMREGMERRPLNAPAPSARSSGRAGMMSSADPSPA